MDVAYAPGDGLLLGAGPRWLLLGRPVLDPSATETLWQLLVRSGAGSAVPEQVLAAVDDLCGADCSLVLLDLTPGAETTIARGTGHHSTLAGVHTLSVDGSAVAPVRRLLGGVVAAAAVRLSPPVGPTPVTGPVTGPATGPVTGRLPGLIDGVPAEILAAHAPIPQQAQPPPTPPTSAVVTDEPPEPSRRRLLDRMGKPVSDPARSPVNQTVRRARPELEPDRDPDHDGHTSYRPEPAGGGPVPDKFDHLRQATHETVLGVHCPSGHVSAAYQPRCRVCDEPVAPQEPRRIARPRLGVLHLPDGDRVPLDRGVVLGRQPAPTTPGDDWPHLVTLAAGSSHVSRSHLLVELDGWLVLASDLGSRGGTTLRVPGRAPQRIRAHERYVWEPGQVLDLADSYEIVYEVTG